MKKPLPIVSIEPDHGCYLLVRAEKKIKTPMGADVRLPTSSLACAIADEINRNGPSPIISSLFPLTTLVFTAFDHTLVYRDQIINDLVCRMRSDFLCYHLSPEDPLGDQQKKKWGVMVDRFSNYFGIRPAITFNLNLLSPDQEIEKKIRFCAEHLDIHHLTILHVMADLSQSVILALLMMESQVTQDEIESCFFLEQDFMAGRGDIQSYGDDPVIAGQKKTFKIECEALFTYQSLLKITDVQIISPDHVAKV